jgi:hypothetical protein
MPIVGIVAGSIALLLLVFMGAAFLFAPDKANEWFGTWSTQNASPLQRRAGGLVWIVLILFIALVMVGAFWK